MVICVIMMCRNAVQNEPCGEGQGSTEHSRTHPHARPRTARRVFQSTLQNPLAPHDVVEGLSVLVRGKQEQLSVGCLVRAAKIVASRNQPQDIVLQRIYRARLPKCAPLCEPRPHLEVWNAEGRGL